MRCISIASVLLCVCAAFSSVAVQPARADHIQELSFKPPFDRIDGDGRRIVNDTWTYGGSADAKKHFVRLTTDRQSKRGYLWQREPLNRETFTAVLTFRISGQGKRWFGDGIGLWFTNHGAYVQGPNHGFTDSFTGVGIVIDTFNNPEHKGGHKDISIQVNDGSKTVNQINDETRVGCDAAVRYHEKSAAFDPVHSMSRIKVKIDRTKLTLEVDPASNGRWVACAEVNVPLGSNWLSSSTIGITGSTGALADNHDVIRFDAFSDVSDNGMSAVDADVILHSVSKDYNKWLESPSCGSDCVIAVLQKELNNFRIQAEHRFSDLKEKTVNNVAKLKKQEQDHERRVAEIEQKVSGSIDAQLDEKERNLGDEVNSKIAKELTENSGASSGWKTPFYLLVIGLGAGGFYVYRKYVALMKSHLL